MRKSRKLELGLLVLIAVLFTPQQGLSMPGAINYQGYVETQDGPFTGTGLFQFAILNGSDAMVWSNDAVFPPSAALSIPVTEGLFSVVLGDAMLMTPIPFYIFEETTLKLRIWFNDGVHGFELLSPDQQLTSAGFAMRSDRSDTVDGYHYNSSWPTTLSNIRTALGNDFHTVGGIDDDQPDDDSEVPDNISINNGNLYSLSGAGTVGIGISAPETKLHVEGTLTVDQKIQADDSGGLEFATDDGLVRMFMSDTGRIGIGTTSPNSYALLDVVSTANSGIRINSATSFDSYVLFANNDTMKWGLFQGYPSDLNFTIYNYDYSTSVLSLYNTFVGIRTTTPETELHVEGVLTLDQKLMADDSGGLEFASDEGQTRMILTDAGDLGIGAGSPIYRLHIIDDGPTIALETTTTGNPTIRFRENAVDRWMFAYSTVSNYLYLYDYTALNEAAGNQADDRLGTALVIKDGTGHIGLGTTAPGSHKLYVTSAESGSAGSTVRIDNTAPDGIGLSIDVNSTDLAFLASQHGGGDIMRCDSYTGGWHVAMKVKSDGSVESRGTIYTGTTPPVVTVTGYGTWTATTNDIGAADDLLADGNLVVGDNAYVNGDILALGAIKSGIATEKFGLRSVFAEYAMEAYVSCSGFGTLRDGKSTVELSEEFQQAVLIDEAHQLLVYITPSGDCQGLYVAETGAEFFTVAELMGGRSDVGFQWEASALRKGYENKRAEQISLRSLVTD